MVELLREDPQFAEAYLSAALAEADEPGGREGLLSALRQIAEAKGMANVASRAGIPRWSMYRVLSPTKPIFDKASCCRVSAGWRTKESSDDVG